MSEKVISYFEKYNLLVSKYGKEKVIETIGSLSPVNKEIMYLYFGINTEKMSASQIAKKLNYQLYNICHHLTYSINKIDELLIAEKENKVEVVDRRDEFFNKYSIYSKEEINNAFSKMEGVDKEILFLYYGLDGTGLKPKDISKKYDTNYHNVYNYLKRSLTIFERYLNGGGEEKIVIHTPDQFYSKFKGFSKEEIDETILKLNETTREILTGFYGLTGTTTGDKELARKHDLDIQKIYDCVREATLDISKLLKKEKREVTRKKEFYGMFEGCSEEVVDEALEKLDERSKDILKSYYGINCSVFTMVAIGAKYDLTRARIEQIIKKGLGKMKKFVKSPEEKKKEMREIFYNKFKGYSKEEIEKVLLSLKDKDREIISCYYGFGDELLDVHQLANKYCLSYSAVNSIIKKKTEVIYEFLKNPLLKNGVNNRNFYKIFSNYTKEEVDVAFNKLQPYDRQILSLYYGLGGDSLTAKEIASSLNIDYKHVYYYLKTRMAQIEKLLMLSGECKGTTKEDFYKLFRGFSSKQVKKAMMNLNKKDLEVVVMYYGLIGEAKSLEYIVKKYKSYRSIVSERISKSIGLIKNAIIKDMKNSFLLDVGCEDTERVKKVLKDIPDNDLRLISLYYGLNGKDIMSKLEMSERLNVSEEVIDEKINEIIETIKNKLLRNGR